MSTERRPRGFRALQIRQLLFASLLALACWAPAGRSAEVRVIIAEQATYYRDAVTSLRQRLNELDPGAIITTHSRFDPAWGAEDQVVTVGTRAMEMLRTQSPQRRALHLFVTTDAWEQQARDPGAQHNPALAIDQPPRHLIALARALLPEARNLAVVLGPISRRHLELVQQEAGAAGFEPLIGVLNADDNPLATLSPLIHAADAALVLPDQAEFNNAVAKWLLQIGFREKTPVIAFSRSYASAGALASIFVTPEEMGRDGAELLDRWRRSGEPPRGLHYPSARSIATNAAVAAALGIALPDAEHLERRFTAALEAML